MTEKPNKKADFWDKLKEGGTLWDFRVQIFSGALLLIGLILAYFYIRVGAALVGLGFGICFFEEIHSYFVQLRDIYSEHGIFKTLVFIGTILFFLIAIPTFLVATAVGYAAVYIIGVITKK